MDFFSVFFGIVEIALRNIGSNGAAKPLHKLTLAIIIILSLLTLITLSLT